MHGPGYNFDRLIRPRDNFEIDQTWVIRNFTISTNTALIENREIYKYYRVREEECLLTTSIEPYLPKDDVVDEIFRELFLCWFSVDFKFPAPY